MTGRRGGPNVDGGPRLGAGQYERLSDIGRGEVWVDDGVYVWVPSVPDRTVKDISGNVAPLLRRQLATVGDPGANGRRPVRLTDAGEQALAAYIAGQVRPARPVGVGRIAAPDPDGQTCPHCRVRYAARRDGTMPQHYRPGSHQATDLCPGEGHRPEPTTPRSPHGGVR